MSPQKPAERYFRPGQFLFRENDAAESLFIIQKGSVAVKKRAGSSEVELARLFSNEVLGEMSFFDRAPRVASAVALTEVTALEIQFEALDVIYQQVPSFLKTMIAAMAERLRRTDDAMQRMKRELEKRGLGSDLSSDAIAPEEEPQSDLQSVLTRLDGVGDDSKPKGGGGKSGA